MINKLNFNEVDANERLDELLQIENNLLGIFLYEPGDSVIPFQDFVVGSVRKQVQLTNFVLLFNKNKTQEEQIQKIVSRIVRRVGNFNEDIEVDVFMLSDVAFNEMLDLAKGE